VETCTSGPSPAVGWSEALVDLRDGIGCTYRYDPTDPGPVSRTGEGLCADWLASSVAIGLSRASACDGVMETLQFYTNPLPEITPMECTPRPAG